MGHETHSQEAKADGPFDLSGGALALDFANTVDGRMERPPAPRERLVDYADLVAWAEQAGIIGSAEAEALRAEGVARPQEAGRVVAAARRLRDALYDIFAALAGGESPAEEAVATLNGALPRALGALRLTETDGSFEWSWSLAGRGLERVLAPVIRDAAELLTTEEISRVKQCESETCAWLFLDQSRNRSRRWCDMSACGNRAKARRHYRRVKGGA